jgi:hypothetical protein
MSKFFNCLRSLGAIALGMLATSLPSQAQKEKSEFKIGIYVPPPEEFLNDEQYGYLKEAGIDYVQNVGGRVNTSVETNLKTLELAQKQGLKVYVNDARMYGDGSGIPALVKQYKDHPATSGYVIVDEPDSARLQWAIDTYKKVIAEDPDKTPYVNLLPDYAVNNYEKDYVERWIEGVGAKNLKYLSFDTYPFKVKGRYMKTYYNNLDIIRRAGIKYDVKTSCYLQAFGMDNVWRRPNQEELRLNTYSVLAYGIKNPVWFPYWTPPRSKTEPFTGSAIMTIDGKKSDLFDYVKGLNAEMHQLGKMLINLDAIAVYHTGDSLWLGTTHPPADFLLQTTNKKDDLILSHFKDRKTGANYVMVVNKSITDKLSCTLQASSSIIAIQEISKTTGKPTKTTYNKKTHQLKEMLLAGEGKLFKVL